MTETQPQNPKASKKQSSLTRRIATHQLSGNIALLLFFDVLLLLLLLIFVLYELSAASLSIAAGAATSVSDAPVEVPLGAVPHVLFDSASLSRQTDFPMGAAIPKPIAAALDLPAGTVVGIAFQRVDRISLLRRWLSVQTVFAVPAASPAPAQAVCLVTFRHDAFFLVLWRGFCILLAVEILTLIRGAFKIRRSTRRMLRPILTLTRAAENINKEPSLKLSGAIDTLNTITEQHLDKRIAMEDERVELKGLASAINGMLDRLDAAYHAQLRFVSDASHELRTPISVIQGYANLLDRWGKKDEKTLQESIDAIKNEAGSMQALVEQLLFLARGDNYSVVPALTEVDISLAAEEVLRETKLIDPTHQFQSRIEPGVRIRGDIPLLKRALRILIDNSVKYTPAGGTITIKTVRSAQKPGFAEISVSDSGIGIPDEALPHLFERFYRADESRARKSGGAGLGLAIAKWIVDSHQGFVEVVSRKDMGAKFTLFFPAMDADGD
jgi:signal transduction histidine kinase